MYVICNVLVIRVVIPQFTTRCIQNVDSVTFLWTLFWIINILKDIFLDLRSEDNKQCYHFINSYVSKSSNHIWWCRWGYCYVPITELTHEPRKRRHSHQRSELPSVFGGCGVLPRNIWILDARKRNLTSEESIESWATRGDKIMFSEKWGHGLGGRSVPAPMYLTVHYWMLSSSHFVERLILIIPIWNHNLQI